MDKLHRDINNRELLRNKGYNMRNKFLLTGLSITFLLFLVCALNVSAASYYFNATTGNDANDCSTSALACKTIADLNGKILVAGDNVYFNRGDLWRLAPGIYDSYLVFNESGSSITGNVTIQSYGTGSKPLFLGSINGSNSANWTQGTQINITGDLATTFYVNTQYYNLTMQEGTIITWYTVHQPGFNWARGDANVNLTYGAMLNGSLYLMGGNVAATSCTAANQSDSLGIGIRVNCSNANAENVWTFYDSYITVNSTSKLGNRYLWQHALAKAGSIWQNYNFWNGTSNISTITGYTDWDSKTGQAAVSVWNTTRTNTTLLIDWDEAVTTDFDYASNDSTSTESIRIARGSELTAGTYLFQKIKILPKNMSATHPDEILDVIDAFTSNSNYNDTMTGGTNIWRFNTVHTGFDVGNIVHNFSEEIGGESNWYDGGKQQYYVNLTTQGMFYTDLTNDYTYVYSSTNPATYYSGGLELSLGKNDTVNNEMVKISGNYYLIKDLDFRNAGNAIIQPYYIKGVVLYNLTMRFAGGIYETGGLRYGQCISYHCRNQNNKVLYNDLYGCFDVGIGFESYSSCTDSNQTNFEAAYNKIAYSGVGIGYSNSQDADGTMNLINSHHNSIVKTGYGWVHQRNNQGIGILTANAPRNVSNYNFTDNLIYDSHHAWVNLGWNSATRYNSSVDPNMNYNLYYWTNNTPRIYWNGTTYNNISAFQTGEGQEANGYEGDPFFLSLDPLSTDYLVPSGSACTMSSTGSYVGAVPCETTSPIVNIINSSFLTTDSTPDFWFNYTDSASVNASCVAYANGVSKGSNSSVLNNTATKITLGTLSAGNNTIQVNCTDLSMNLGTDNFWIYLDAITPTITIINNSFITTDDTPNIWFNVTETSNCTLYINDTIQGNNPTTTPNTPTYLTSGTLIDGNKTIYINCTDSPVGNTGKSNVIYPLINIAPISGLTQTDSTEDSITLTWIDPTANFNHTEIWIYNTTWTLVSNETGGTTIITGLTPSSSYNVMGVSVGDGGTRGSNSSIGATTSATTNDTSTFYVSHTFTELNMSDGCSGDISFAANSTHWAAICLNDMTSDVYCYNYTTGTVGVDETTYFNYTLTYGNSYRFHYIWNMIYYEEMNDSDINDMYDVGASVTATYRTECQNTYVDECSSTIDNHQLSTASNCYSDSIAYPYTCDILYIAGHYCDNDYAINLDDKNNYVKALPDDYRVYVGQSTKAGASNASGTCELINRRKSSSTCYSIVTPYYLMDECTNGVEEYERYDLCDYAGSYDSYTESFTYYGSADEQSINNDAGEEVGSSATVIVTDSGLPPAEITITSPTASQQIIRYINITYDHVSEEFEYYNISLLNDDYTFNQSIISNNSNNEYYYWDLFPDNITAETYYLKVAMIDVSGSELAYDVRSIIIIYDSQLNITATNNNTGSPISDFGINLTDLTSGTSFYVTASNNISSFNITKNNNYSIKYVSSTYNETSTYSSNSSNFQSVNLNIIAPVISIGTSCGQSTAMTFRLYDEDTLIPITGDFSYNFNITIANTTVLLYGNYSSSNNISLCVNASTGQTWTVNKGEIQYESSGYVNRRYYVFGGTRITGTTTNISMYDLNSTLATAFQITANARDLTLYDNKYVTLVRWYPELNQYNVVDMGLTDDIAQTVLYARTQDTDYRMGIYELDGTLIYLANPIRMVCLSTPCSYDLISTASSTSYSTFEKLQYSWNVNKTSGIWIFTYNDPSQASQTISLNIYKDSGINEILICQNNLTAYTGAISCNSSGWTGSLRGVVVRTASPGVTIAQYLASVGESAFKSSLGLFLVIILALPIVFLLAIISPIAALIGGVLALIPGVYLGSIDFAVVGAAAIMAVIIIHFMKR